MHTENTEKSKSILPRILRMARKGFVKFVTGFVWVAHSFICRLIYELIGNPRLIRRQPAPAPKRTFYGSPAIGGSGAINIKPVWNKVAIRRRRKLQDIGHSGFGCRQMILQR